MPFFAPRSQTTSIVLTTNKPRQCHDKHNIYTRILPTCMHILPICMHAHPTCMRAHLRHVISTDNLKHALHCSVRSTQPVLPKPSDTLVADDARPVVCAGLSGHVGTSMSWFKFPANSHLRHQPGRSRQSACVLSWQPCQAQATRLCHSGIEYETSQPPQLRSHTTTTPDNEDTSLQNTAPPHT